MSALQAVETESSTPVPLTGTDPRWARARCRDGRGSLSALFFSDDPLGQARAKAICRLCPLSAPCLAGALERGEPWGVWGGQLLVNGVPVAFKRPRGRPPKFPRPELVVDEVPTSPHLVA
jgi:WhiB family redox-sensing transcriptional regulator